MRRSSRLAVSIDGKRFASAGENAIVRLWNAESSESVQIQGDPRLADNVAQADATVAFTKSALEHTKQDIKSYEGTERMVMVRAMDVKKAEEEKVKAEKMLEEKKQALEKAKSEKKDAKAIEQAENAVAEAMTAVQVAQTVIDRAKVVAERAVADFAAAQKLAADFEATLKIQEDAEKRRNKCRQSATAGKIAGVFRRQPKAARRLRRWSALLLRCRKGIAAGSSRRPYGGCSLADFTRQRDAAHDFCRQAGHPLEGADFLEARTDARRH